MATNTQKTKRLADLIQRVQTRAYKHLAGRHAQKRHGWRYGAGSRAPDDPGEAEVYAQHAARRGVAVETIRNRKKSAGEKGVMVKGGSLSKKVHESEKDYLKDKGVPATMVTKAVKFLESLAIIDTRSGIEVRPTKFSALTKQYTNDLVLQMTGDLYREGGYGRVGYIKREVRFEKKKGGEVQVYIENAYLEINSNSQGTGFAQRLYQHSEEQARMLGIDAIHVSANIDVGGYAWAKMGFRFQSDSDRQRIGDEFAMRWDRDYRTKRPEFLGRKWEPYEMAAFVAPDGVKLGKETLLGNYWDGVKFLNDSDPGYRVGEAYYATKE